MMTTTTQPNLTFDQFLEQYPEGVYPTFAKTLNCHAVRAAAPTEQLVEASQPFSGRVEIL